MFSNTDNKKPWQMKSTSPCSCLLRSVFPGSVGHLLARTPRRSLISRVQEATRCARPARSRLPKAPMAGVTHSSRLSFWRGLTDASGSPRLALAVGQESPCPADPRNGVPMGCSAQIVEKTDESQRGGEKVGEEGGGGPRSQLARG